MDNPWTLPPENWYKAAKTIDQNREANEAFQSASRPVFRPTPRSVPPITTKASLSGNFVPVNLDPGLKKSLLPSTCYRCQKTGHRAPNCPDRHDIRTSSLEELEMEIMVRRDMTTIAEPTLEPTPEDFVQDNE